MLLKLSLRVQDITAKMSILTKSHSKGRSSAIQDVVEGNHGQTPPDGLQPDFIHYSNSRERFLMGKLGKLALRNQSQPPARQAVSSWRVTAGVAMQGNSKKSQLVTEYITPDFSWNIHGNKQVPIFKKRGFQLKASKWARVYFQEKNNSMKPFWG